uniref:Uncharacterized protein n=1 Tax=Oryza meridionalis TaxID=40149 RepID=A0A0E0F5N5_9ORYZ
MPLLPRRCATATKGGDSNRRWDFSPPLSPGRRVAVASPWSTVGAAQVEIERGEGREEGKRLSYAAS